MRLSGLFIAGVLALAAPSLALAAEHAKGGLGFHSSDAPIGIRWWLDGQKAAVDLGLGFASDDVGDESLTRFTVEGGVPIVWKSWERVHAMFRPGIAFTSQDVIVSDGKGGSTTDSATTFRILGEIEAEVFLAKNVSVSASHGLGVSITSPPGDGDSTTDFGTFGNGVTEVGFHVYLFGDD